MNVGFVFLALALASAAIGVAAYRAPPARMGFSLLIVTVIIVEMAAGVFGGLAALALLFGAL